MIWSETEQLMEEPVQQHSSWKGQAACEEGCHNTWAGPSIVKYQTDNSCTGLATIWSETAQLMEGPLWQTVLFMHWPGHNVESDGATHGGASVAGGKGQHSSWAGLSIVKPQTVLFMHWPSHDVESDGATHGGASAAGGKGRRTSWAGPSIVKHQTVQLMHWPGNNMESDGATNGGASAAGEEGQHSSWAGPSIVKHQTIELMLWPSHNGESDGAAHGGASAAAVIWNEMAQLMEGPVQQSPAKSASASPQIMGGASAEGTATIWSEREIFCLSLISLSSSSFPVTSQICISIPADHGGPVQKVRADGRAHQLLCPWQTIRRYNSCTGMATIWSEREIFCLSLISLSSDSFSVTSQMCFGIPTVDGGATVADEGRGQSSWAGMSMVNHPKIQLMYWHGCDMDLISLSSSSFPVTSQMRFSIPAVDGGAGVAGWGGWQNSWACLSTANHQKIQLMHWYSRDMDLISLSSSSCPGTSPSCIGILTIDGGASAAGPSAHCEKVVAHATKRQQTKETAESLQYPEITAPTVIVDGSSNVNLWYLPGALDSGHQRQIWNSLSRMAVPLKDSIKPSGMGGWQKDKALFQEMADLKGSIDLSPGWYQQGRGPLNFHPEVSQLLKSGREQNGTWEWVDEMSEFHALLSGTLAVIHPHIISIMANRATPYHRDVNGQQQWLDMLITIGHYAPLDFVIPTLNLWFRYNPGTIIAMPGSALEHG
ncbi:hypothetical protein EDD17DRAFT_1507887, partial [Pisolithus thermaeus]